MPAPALRSFMSPALRRVVTRDRLGFEILLHAVAAPLAAVAGLLVASERRRAVVRHALQVDVACADLAAHLARTLDRAGRDVAGKTVGCVVGDLDGVGLV